MSAQSEDFEELGEVDELLDDDPFFEPLEEEPLDELEDELDDDPEEESDEAAALLGDDSLALLADESLDFESEDEPESLLEELLPAFTLARWSARLSVR